MHVIARFAARTNRQGVGLTGTGESVDRPVDVISYAGARGEERPTAVRVGGEALRVTAVRGMWLETGLDPREGIRRWFDLQLEGGRRLTVYYDEALDGWFCRDDARFPPAGP